MKENNKNALLFSREDLELETPVGNMTSVIIHQVNKKLHSYKINKRHMSNEKRELSSSQNYKFLIN